MVCCLCGKPASHATMLAVKGGFVIAYYCATHYFKVVDNRPRG